MPELHETMMGRKLIEHTLPNIGDQLKRIADALEIKTPAKDVIEIAVCYYTDEHSKKIYDYDHMYSELDSKIKEIDKP